MFCSKGERAFIKNNMARENDFVSGKIKALVSFVVDRIAKEDGSSGPRC